MSSLLFHRPDGRQIRYPLRRGRSIFGRQDTCDLALDGDGISRRHFVIDGRGEGFILRDLSRNGTLVNDAPIDGPHRLADGDRIGFGPWVATFSGAPSAPASRTTTRLHPTRWHEELVDADEERVVRARSTLHFTAGPHEGQTHRLTRHRVSLGGTGADVVLDPSLPRKALELRVTRGRVMVSAAPDLRVFVAGSAAPAIMPVHDGELVRLGEHAFVVETELDDRTRERSAFGEMVGTSSRMRSLFGRLERMAPHAHPVLLLGESGTGKELAARALHRESPRADGPFEPVNCGALPENLVESTLFGHEKGAFTGATDRQDGAFQRAAGGTLFLDEIGELHLPLQAKLLRALESGEIRRVGGGSSEFPDVRVIAATNREPQHMVERGEFRRDLFFRLNVLTARLPPLRERPEDIPFLAETLLERHLPGASLTSGALERLRAASWPGNVRELKNVLVRAFVLGGPRIEPDAIDIQTAPQDAGAPMFASDVPTEVSELRDALDRNHGNRSAAARELGMPRSTLLYKLRKWGIQ